MEGIPTGIDFLDAGADGFFRAKPYLAFGGSGSGKSIFGMQYAHAGLVAGESALYVCREKADDLIQQGERLGFPLGKYVDNDQLVLLEYDEGFREIVARSGPEAVLIELQAEVESLGVSRVILDPVDPFFSSMDDESILRSELRMLTRRFEEMGWSSLMLCDSGVMQQRFVLRVFSEVCWGLFELQRGNEGDGPEHSLLVYKMRNVQLEKSRFDFRIGENGIAGGMPTPVGVQRGFARFHREERQPAPVPEAIETPIQPTIPAPSERAPTASSSEPESEFELLDDSALDEIERLARQRHNAAAPELTNRTVPEPPVVPKAELSVTVLAIESDEDTRRTMLRACGSKITVVEAADGMAGLRAAAVACPDLILVAARMPQLNGVGLCRILRELGVTTPIVVLCSAHGGPGEAPRALAAGADVVLAKPIDAPKLRATMVSLLRERPPGSQPWPTIDPEVAPSMLVPRSIDAADLEDEISRARSWAEEAGVPVSLVGYEFRFVEGASTAFIGQFRRALAESIRAEDAIAQLDERRLVALLVDADAEGARAAVRRVHQEMAGAAAAFLKDQPVKPKALYRVLTLQPDRLSDDAIEPPYLARLFEETPQLIEEDADDRPGEPVEKYPLIEVIYHALAGEQILLTSPLDGAVHEIRTGADGVRETTVDGHGYRQQDAAKETPAGFRARSGVRIVWVHTSETPRRLVARVEEGRVFRGKEA